MPSHTSSIEEHGQVGCPPLIASGLNLDANRNFVAREGDFLDDDISDRDVVGIGNTHRHGIDRNAPHAEVMDRGFGTTR